MAKQKIIPLKDVWDEACFFTSTLYAIVFPENKTLDRGMYKVDEMNVGILKDLIANGNDVIFVAEINEED